MTTIAEHEKIDLRPLTDPVEVADAFNEMVLVPEYLGLADLAVAGGGPRHPRGGAQRHRGC
jgi:hypothetical protein